MAKTNWELHGNIYKGDTEILACGTKTQCKKAFGKMTEDEKQKYFFIELIPYDADYSEQLDFDECLYHNPEILKAK